MRKSTCMTGGWSKQRSAKLFVAENGQFGTPFSTPRIPLKKFMWVPFLRSFPRNEAHKLFSEGPKLGVWVGANKFMLKKFMCFFRPLSASLREQEKRTDHAQLGQPPADLLQSAPAELPKPLTISMGSQHPSPGGKMFLYLRTATFAGRHHIK